ncbi:MAG: hypothetical protein EBR20_07575, partial [Bacteroidetes bacterium]|nr:hypothetical protein [Bacteroidota bacterium]
MLVKATVSMRSASVGATVTRGAVHPVTKKDQMSTAIKGRMWNRLNMGVGVGTSFGMKEDLSFSGSAR